MALPASTGDRVQDEWKKKDGSKHSAVCDVFTFIFAWWEYFKIMPVLSNSSTVAGDESRSPNTKLSTVLNHQIISLSG